MNEYRYDIVFWSYISSSVDRVLPLMVRLKEKGMRPLLFYQDYDMSDNGSPIQDRIIKENGLDVLTYGDFLPGNFKLFLLQRLYTLLPEGFLRNKIRGLRQRILRRYVRRPFLENIFDSIGQKINIFDTIGTDDPLFPIGSSYIKDIADARGIPVIAIPHGLRVYYRKGLKPRRYLDFETVVICNDDEREYIAGLCKREDTDILEIGDPRFDSGWKEYLRGRFTRPKEEISPEGRKVILYLLPAFETLRIAEEKDRALGEMASIVSQLGDVRLLIRPHPRWRQPERISRIMRENGVHDFVITGNDPLITYAEAADRVISPATSALFDFIPEMPGKVIIFDDVSTGIGMRNIFREKVPFFENTRDMGSFLKRDISGPGRDDPGYDPLDMEAFCNRSAAAGKGLDTIIDRYIRLIEEKAGDKLP
jgi:hypothetical protein